MFQSKEIVTYIILYSYFPNRVINSPEERLLCCDRVIVKTLSDVILAGNAGKFAPEDQTAETLRLLQLNQRRLKCCFDLSAKHNASACKVVNVGEN